MTYRIDAIDETTGTLTNVETGVSIADTLHNLAGIRKMLEHTHATIALIRRTPSTVEARSLLQSVLGVDSEQANAILALRLSTIVDLERNHVLTGEEREQLHAERETWMKQHAEIAGFERVVAEARQAAATGR